MGQQEVLRLLSRIRAVVPRLEPAEGVSHVARDRHRDVRAELLQECPHVVDIKALMDVLDLLAVVARLRVV